MLEWFWYLRDTGLLKAVLPSLGWGILWIGGDRVCKIVQFLQQSVVVEAATCRPGVYRVEHVLGRVLGAASQQGGSAVAEGNE